MVVDKAVADWHGIQAVRAYHKGDMPGYKRHIRIADQMWGSDPKHLENKRQRLKNAFTHRR